MCKLLQSVFYSFWRSIRIGLPRWHNGKESSCQCRRCKRLGFNPCVGKIPWRREWQPAPVFLPGEFHGQTMGSQSRTPLRESDTHQNGRQTPSIIKMDFSKYSHSWSERYDSVPWNTCEAGISTLCHGCGSLSAGSVHGAAGISGHHLCAAPSPPGPQSSEFSDLQHWGVEVPLYVMTGHLPLCYSLPVRTKKCAVFAVILSDWCRRKLWASPRDGEESSCSRDEVVGGSRLLCVDLPVVGVWV